MSAAKKSDAITITVNRDIVDAALSATLVMGFVFLLSRSDKPIKSELIEDAIKAMLPYNEAIE